MEAEMEQNINVTLKLNEKEARWLKHVVQNPIHVGVDDPLSETLEDRKMRRRFWQALEGVNL